MQFHHYCLKFIPAHLPQVDIDAPELAATVMSNSISAVPTFVGHRGANRLSAFSGADRAQLQRLVLELTDAAKAG